MRSIQNLMEGCELDWAQDNIDFFGVEPVDSRTSFSAVRDHANECVKKYWATGKCELAQLMAGGLCKDWDLVVPDSLTMEPNEVTMDLGLYADLRDPANPKNDRDHKLLCTLPLPTKLGWSIKGAEYVLRVSATPNYQLICKKQGRVLYPSQRRQSLRWDEENGLQWDEKNFDGPVDVLDEHSRMFLSAVLGEEVTNQNVEQAIRWMPDFQFNSVIYFHFHHTDAIFDAIRNTKRFANPLKNVVLDICAIMKSTDRTGDGEDSFKHLILAQSKLFTLENIRCCVFRSAKFNSVFHFTDVDNVFDAFKTSTNKSSGRSRLLLDDVEVHDGLLWKEVDGVMRNQYELAVNKMLVSRESISCLSSTQFSQNNDPKRIMMSAKLRAQSVPVEAETDSLLHTVPARVVFGEFEGYSYGDSLIISESMAAKLCAHRVENIRVTNTRENHAILSQYEIGDTMKLEDLFQVYQGNHTRLANYRNIRILDKTKQSLKLEVDIPFFIGDKLTNFHASKGVVSLILPDEEMPYLKEDIVVDGKVFPAGPFEMIISGLSVFRRKSMGQLFEAFAMAMDISDVDNVVDACEKYRDQMQSFSEQSVVCHHGVETVKPCGINQIIRLNHDAVTKQSLADLKNNYKGLLKFEEMAAINLNAKNMTSILEELDVRGLNKHRRSFRNIGKMQETGEFESQPADNLVTLELFHAMGYDMETEIRAHSEEPDRDEPVLSEVADNDRIDLFQDIDRLKKQVERARIK